MANCQIKYNQLGQISEVLNSNNNVSELYKTIASHPFVKDKEEALNIYKNIYTSKVDELSSFTHRTKWGFTNSYKEALQELEEGEQIEVGFYGEEFVPIMTIEVNTNPNTVDGFINAQIKNNILSENKVVDPDGTFFQPKGNSAQTRAINSALLDEQLKYNVGLAGYKRHKNNRYSIEAIKPKSFYQDGSVDSKIAQSIAESSMMRTFGKDKVIDKQTLTEDELKVRLLNLLNDLGVKVTSISDYISNYNIKNGVDPSAKALADIANQVVAFQNGEVSVEELSEEVAHFIVEGMPQEQVENLLRNIHKTNEWAEHSNNYRSIYENEVSETDLDNAVRREVLGKVLANSFQTNFSTENRTETGGNIVNRIQELFNNFIDRVKAFFRQEHATQLEDFTNQVNDLLLRGELGQYISSENFKTNKFRFYSVNTSDSNSVNTIRSKSSAAIEVLKRQITDLAKTGKGSGVSRQQLKQALLNLENNATIQSITTFLEVTRKQINYIDEALKNNAKDEYTLAQEEVTVFESLKNDLNPILAELRERVRQETGQEWRTIEDRITQSLDSIDKIQGSKEIQESNVINKLVDKVMERHNLDESYRDYIGTWLETAKSDTSYFHATFGQLIHAQDPLLSLAGAVIQDTMNESRIGYQKSIKTFQQRLKELGIKEAELDQFFDNGYLVDEVDHKAFQDKLLEARMEAFKEVSKSDLSIEELIRRQKSPSNDPKNSLPTLTASQEIDMSKLVRQKQSSLIEKAMKEEYYLEKEEKYKKAGVKQTTIDFLRAISQARANIIQPARGDNGIIDRTLLSASDNKRLDELARDRKMAKSPFDSSGKIKKGLKVNPIVSDRESGLFEPEYVLDSEVTPTEEAIIAADLQAIDAQYLSDSFKKNEGKKDIPKAFLEGLEKAQNESNEAALNFLKLNANMSFTSDFWDSFGKNLSLTERLQELQRNVEPTRKLAIQKLLDEIDNLSKLRKNLLKVYQNPNNPSEIDVDYMDKGVREDVAKYTEDLNTKYNEAFRLLKDQENVVEDADILSEVTTNEAYRKALEDQNIESAEAELEFIQKHVTKSDLLRISQLRGFLEDYSKGLKDNVPLALKRYVEANIDLDNFTREDVSIATRNFAKTKTLPYYKRVAPEGHKALMSELNSGDKTALQFVDEVINGEHNIEINPNYSYFQQDENDMINPNYKTEYEGGYLQPKKDQFKNKKFDELFAPRKDKSGNYITEKDQNGKDRYVPTKNTQLYEAYESLKQLQRENLELLGETGSHSLYKLPQISKSGLEKTLAFANKATGERLGEAVKDFAFYRVDEMERGAEFDGQTLSNSKIIPKYYLRDLESEDDLTEQVFFAYAAFTQQSHLHRARRHNIGDMFALREKMMTRNTASGKAAEATRTAKMFDSYMDSNFFGITEQSKVSVNILGREVDLTKLARKFLNFIKFKNLGFSAIVPATSWLTAEVNTKIEQWVQEHTNTRSGQMAFKEYKKLAAPAAKEFVNLRSDAKLSVLGEFMGIFDLANRYENASYNSTVRTGQKLGMGLHQAANFPIIPRVMLSVLMDTRVVDGNIINYNDFKRAAKRENPSITNKEVDANWSKYEDEAVYNYLDVSETTVEWNKKALENKLDRQGEELDNFLKNKLNGIQSRIEEASSNIDGSISQYRQVAASRHYLLNYFMTHRNWLSIATSRRFKLGQTNLQTGEQEEGSWVSAYNFLGDYFKELSGKNRKDYRESMREQWANADETQRKNLRRVGIDLAVLNAMVLAGFIIANMADDDENEDLWGLQMANYLYHRTLNETASSSLALPLQYFETLESPFVGLNTVAEIGKLYKVFDFDPVEAGKYRGMTVAERQLVKTVPGVKQAREIYDPKSASDTYRFYNASNFNAVPLNWFMSKEK